MVTTHSGSLSAATPPPNIQSAPPLVSFSLKDVPPDQALYLQNNDFIGFNFLTNTANQQIKVNYRYLTPQGEIKEGSFTTAKFNPTLFQKITLGECWLLSFDLEQLVTTAGQWCFAQVVLLRNSTAVSAIGNSYATIWQGYVPGAAPEGWPGTPLQRITDGQGFMRSIVGASPAAGAEVNETVPGNSRWQLIALTVTLNTSAAVASRNTGFKITDGITTKYLIHSSNSQAASSTLASEIAPGQPFYSDTIGSQLIPLPAPLWLNGGYHLQTDTPGLQAGDQYSAPLYYVLEWGIWDQ